MSVFKKRGLPVEIVTTSVAELDIALYGIADERVEQIGAALKGAPLLRTDTDLGGVRIREFTDFEVAYLVTSEDSAFMVTIGNIQPVGSKPNLERLLRTIGIIAMLRGASGL